MAKKKRIKMAKKKKQLQIEILKTRLSGAKEKAQLKKTSTIMKKQEAKVKKEEAMFKKMRAKEVVKERKRLRLEKIDKAKKRAHIKRLEKDAQIKERQRLKDDFFKETGIKQFNGPKGQLSAQGIIDESSVPLTPLQKKELFKEVAEKEKVETKKVIKEVRGERGRKLATIKGEVKRAFLRTSGEDRLKRIREVPRRLKGTKQPKFSAAATKLTSAFLPPGAMAGSTSSSGTVDSGRGRGRPSGTFKSRYLPDGRVVKVPTHIYKKMLSEVKVKQRLAIAQQQAKKLQQFEAEKLAMQTDPRFTGAGKDEAFLQEPDMAHEQRVEQINQQQALQQIQQAQQVRQPSTMGSKLRSIMRGNRPPKFGEQPFQEPFQEQFQQPQQASQQSFQAQPQRDMFQRQTNIDPQLHRPANPQVSAVSLKSNILNVPSIFGRKETNPIGFRR